MAGADPADDAAVRMTDRAAHVVSTAEDCNGLGTGVSAAAVITCGGLDVAAPVLLGAGPVAGLGEVDQMMLPPRGAR
jgi:hypothetical protein